MSSQHVRLALRAAALLLLVSPATLQAQNETVAETLHNLSVSGPGEIRAVSETQICKFCHVPHNATSPSPLWGRRLPDVEYVTPQIARGRPDARRTPQPDGSSRLCLSCHDGTIALGDLVGEPRDVEMTAAGPLTRGRRGFLGTDLSGSHPISFVMTEDPDKPETDSDIGLRPLAVVRGDPAVRLDGEGKIQCTTCHDAHADRFYVPDKVPRFWVKPTVDEVCTTCHALR